MGWASSGVLIALTGAIRVVHAEASAAPNRTRGLSPDPHQQPTRYETVSVRAAWCPVVLSSAVLPDQNTCSRVICAHHVIRRPKASVHRLSTEETSSAGRRKLELAHDGSPNRFARQSGGNCRTPTIALSPGVLIPHTREWSTSTVARWRSNRQGNKEPIEWPAHPTGQGDDQSRQRAGHRVALDQIKRLSALATEHSRPHGDNCTPTLPASDRRGASPTAQGGHFLPCGLSMACLF